MNISGRIIAAAAIAPMRAIVAGDQNPAFSVVALFWLDPVP